MQLDYNTPAFDEMTATSFIAPGKT